MTQILLRNSAIIIFSSFLISRKKLEIVSLSMSPKQPTKQVEHSKVMNNIIKTLDGITKNIKELISEELTNAIKESMFTSIRNQINLNYDSKLTCEQFSDQFAQLISLSCLYLYQSTKKRTYEQHTLIDTLQSKITLFLKTYKYLNEDMVLPASIRGELGKLVNNDSVKDFKNLPNKDFNLLVELFLSIYDPNLKFTKGLFYTPVSVVNFIIYSIDEILKDIFGLKQGLRSKNIQIFDPALGNGLFLDKLFAFLQENLPTQEKPQEFPSIWGFELLLVPFFLADFHLRLSNTKFSNVWNLILGNTLTKKDKLEDILKNQHTEEKKPVAVIFGNPPYSGHSSSETPWISDLIHGRVEREKSYFHVNGNPLMEKNPKWLNDDYVKFIRLGQWMISKAGVGLLAFITNHSFLDNPTFRGMRESLLREFSEIYIIDLHGNTRRKEKAPTRIRDENIFDIQQGVCITFFIKRLVYSHKCKVYRFDLWGTKEYKFNYFQNTSFSSIEWKEVTPFAPWYMFYNQHLDRWLEYSQWMKITEIFSLYSVGIMTGQDKLTIQKTPDRVNQAVNDVLNCDKEEIERKYNIKPVKRQWTLDKARSDLIVTLKDNVDFPMRNIVPILYRPFDIRYTFFTGQSRGFHERPRGNIMQHMIKGSNLGLIVSRNSKPAPWRDVLVTKWIIELGVIATRPGNNAPLFPLYLYNQGEKELNFTPTMKRFIFLNYQIDENLISPIFYYIYALLHSGGYRKRYEEFLKIDFPHIPFPSSTHLLNSLIRLGKELTDLHLREKKEDGTSGVSFSSDISTEPLEVKRLQYHDRKLYISKNHYITGIPKRVLDFHIGTYRLCYKWLKSTRKTQLTQDQIIQFKQLVKIIQGTIVCMDRIDQEIQKFGGWPCAFISK
ncbi:MAG: hypothetical protein EAX86_04260 [Candidatus Heimdallarchaeota archaeon]|nr:hypothetical protein [Candidatus Heimdallarchaeota archaeon]